MSKYKIIEDENKKNDSNTDLKVAKNDKTMTKNNKTKKDKTKKKQKEKGKLKRKIGETFAELKNVTWPSFKTIFSKTGTVLLFCALSFVVLLVIDLLLQLVTTWSLK